MSFRLQAGTDELLLQDGTDKLLLQDESAGGVELSIPVGVGSVTLSGHDPNVRYIPRLISYDRVVTRRVSIGSGVHRQDIYIRQKVPFRIYEQEATEESVEVSVSAGAGSVLIQGAQAGTFAEQVITVGVGDVSLDGAQASLDTDLELDAPAGVGDVVVQGNQASLSTELELDVPVGSGLVVIDGGLATAEVPGQSSALAGVGSVVVNGLQVTTDLTVPVTPEESTPDCGPAFLWSFFFNDGTTQQTYSGGGSEDLIQLRLREDEELLKIITEFVKAA